MATQIPQADYSVNEDDLLLFNDTDVLDDDLLDNTDLAVYDAAWMADYPENPLFKFKIDGSFKYDARYHESLWVEEDPVDDAEYDYDNVGTLVEEGTADAVELANGFDSLAAGAVVYDTYSFTASDGWNTSDPVEVVVKIVGVNDDPNAVDDSAVFDPATATQGGEEGSEYKYIAIDVLANDSDVDVWPVADELSITALEDIADGSDPADASDSDDSDGLEIITDAGGSLRLDESGELHYIAADGFFGIDTVRYTVSDGNGGEDTAELRITVLPDNGNPVATDDTYTMETVEGEQVRTYLYSVGEDHSTGEAPEDTTEKDFGTEATDDGPSVLANDTDPDNDELAALLSVPEGETPILRRVDKDGVEITENGEGNYLDEYGNSILDGDDKPIVGELTDFNSDGSFTYDHKEAFQSLAEGESAFVAFDYSAYDGDSQNDDAMVMIEIQGANDDPVGESPDAVKVYEAGLEIYDENDNLIIKGSGDHRELVEGTHELVDDIPTTQTIRIKVSDVDLSDLDGLFIVAVDENGDPVMDDVDPEAYAKEIEGDYGTLDLDGELKQDNGTYFEDGDYYYEVTYTLEKNADHSDTQGHNGDIFDDFYFRVADENDGLSEWKSLEELGEGEDNLKISVEIIDDVNFLATSPVSWSGEEGDDPTALIDPVDTLADPTVSYVDYSTQTDDGPDSGTDGKVTDTFTLVPGADGQTLHVGSVPDDYVIFENELKVVSKVISDEDANYDFAGLDDNDDDNDMVIGTLHTWDETANDWVEGDTLYTLTFDPEADTDKGSYTFTMLQDAPSSTNDLDFAAIGAGGPQEIATVVDAESGGVYRFNGGFFTYDKADSGYGMFSSFTDSPTSSDDINPNNAGGIGIGNGNIELNEVLMVDLTDPTVVGKVSGVELDVQGVGGGIKLADVLWEAVDWVDTNEDGIVDDGELQVVAFGEVPKEAAQLDFSSKDAHTIRIEPGVEFDFLYVAIDPEDIDSNDKVRINRIATIEDKTFDDIELDFGIYSLDGDDDYAPETAHPGEEGDPDPEYATFTVTIEGTALEEPEPVIEVA